MKIVVIGSTGATGRLILTDAARRGHEITAFARDARALSGVQGVTAVVEGDARDRRKVDEAIAGQEAVITTVRGSGERDVATAIAGTVTAAMLAHGVSRLIMTSAYGLVASKPYVVAPLVRRAFAQAFSDQLAADNIVEQSGLNWTILRATRLTKGTPRQAPRQSAQLFTTGPYSLARSAYAAALLDLAERRDHIREIWHITG